MVTLVKHEWHSVDSQFAIELDSDLLSEIYPDKDENEIEQLLQEIVDGNISIEEIVEAAWENDVELEWERQYDDWWTDRKGGYDVTYELGDENSWVDNTPPPPTHKCTKCRWTGTKYETGTLHLREDGSVISDYYNSDENHHSTKDVCPMCDSNVELTEDGLAKEKKTKDLINELDNMDVSEEKSVDCFTCGEPALESELETMDGQFVCPHCGDGWILSEDRDNTVAIDDEENTWPSKKAIVPNEQQSEETMEDTKTLLPNLPSGEYTIRIWGRTREIGVGQISKEQYEFWSQDDFNNELGEALNESYDYDENNVPKLARFTKPYYEYNDKMSIYGFDSDDTVMTITNINGEEVYHGTLEDFVSEAHGEKDSYYEAQEEIDELYPHYLGKGYWVMHTQGGKGSCFQGTIVVEEGNEFDPRLLKYKTYDVEGSSIVTEFEYDGVSIDDEGMDGEHDNWRGQWSDYQVYHNEN